MVKSTHYIDDKYHVLCLSQGGRTQFYLRRRYLPQSLGLWLETCRIDFEMSANDAA